MSPNKITIRKLIAAILIAMPITFLHAQGNPKETEVWEPVPKTIIPGIGNLPPSDAIKLFDGKDLSQWHTEEGNKEPAWLIERGGILTVKEGSGSIKTKQGFGSCQLHIEWRASAKIKKSGQDRGNSGIIFMGQYELQVLDCYDNKTYSNGQTGSIYKQHIPLVNACLKPGEWQAYDIIFTAPQFNEDDSLLSPARFTVLHNGVLIQNNAVVKGRTVFVGQPFYNVHGEKLPLVLQDHDSPTSFRNIWIREL